MTHRGVSFSEFFVKTPSSRCTELKAQKVANELVMKNKEVRDKLLNNRLPINIVLLTNYLYVMLYVHNTF